jgi:hypothetical protein
MATAKPDLTNEWDKDKLRNWMANARRLGRTDVYKDALRQLCRVEGRNIDDPLESEFAAVMRALEEALTAEAGKTKRLNRTRQKLGRVGDQDIQRLGGHERSSKHRKAEELIRKGQPVRIVGETDFRELVRLANG